MQVQCVCKCSKCGEGNEGSQRCVQVREHVRACVHMRMQVQEHVCSDGDWQRGQGTGDLRERERVQRGGLQVRVRVRVPTQVW